MKSCSGDPNRSRGVKTDFLVSVHPLDEVRIAELREDTSIGVAKLQVGDSVLDLDCRPSDAMALAAYLDKPIRVAEEILSRAGLTLSEDIGEREPLGAGIKKRLEAMGEAGRRRGHAFKTGEKKLSSEELVALFGPLDDE